MKKSLFLSLIFLLMLFNLSYAAQNILDYVKFNLKHNNQFNAILNEDGTIKTIINTNLFSYQKNKNANKLDNNEIINYVIKFLKENPEITSNIPTENLKVEEVVNTENVTHLLFGHYHKNKKVFESELSIHVNNSNLEIVVINNSLTPINNISKLNSKISKDQAIEFAKKHINCKSERIKPKVTETIYTKNKIATEAYKVELASNEPLGDFVFLINSENGKVLEYFDIMYHLNVPNGTVYLNHPLISKVTLEPILNLTNPEKGLYGKWVNVINEDAAPASLNANGNYEFDPNDTHFAEVNVYYHVNKIHDYFAKFGFTGLDRSMRAVVHYGDKYDNAFFSPMEGILAFGDGNKLNNLAYEESVIYHEYTHAVTHAILYMPYYSESGAMNEAFSDYFACTITEDSKVGEWVMAKANKPFIRNIENKNHYPEDIKNEVHYDSQIYSGALWDLRKELNADTCDKIVHFSRYYLKGIKNQKFTDGLNSLILANNEHFNGTYTNIIKKIFENRGIKVKEVNINSDEVISALKFEAVNGNKEAQKLLFQIEN